MPPALKPDAVPVVTFTRENLLKEIERRKRAQALADEASTDFRRFMELSWPVVEPARAFIPNWHMDAMAEHAQAVAEGKIRKLLVTVPPGSSKSIVWAVQWPAWMWVPKRNPGWRSTFASYASTLAERDSVRCRNLLHSVWYRETFRPDWSFATDQNVKSYFVNSAMGHRFSTSVGATATGFRGDAIVCLPAHVKITTDRGPLPIGQIVDGEMPVKVLAFDHESGKPTWSYIERYESSGGRQSVSVRFSDGSSVQCTDDHPVYVAGRGYVDAATLKPGDEVITEASLLRMRGGDHRAPAAARCAGEAPLLLPEVRGHVAAGGQQSVLLGGIGRKGLHNLPGGVHRQAEHTEARGQGGVLLLESLRGSPGQRASARLQLPNGPMRSLWHAGQAQALRPNRDEGILLPLLRGLRAPSSHERDWESKLHARAGSRGVSGGVPEDRAGNTKTRRLLLSGLLEDASADALGAGRASHRPRQAPQRPGQPDFSVPGMSCPRSPEAPAADGRAAVTVEHIERISTPERVFNIRVAGHHNYFANGVLLHNCDDPLQATDRNSDAAILAMVDWWTNEMFNRLNDMVTGTKVIIMQRLSERDLAGHVLREGGYEHLMIPMEYDPARSRATVIGWQDPRAEKGDLMFPQLFPREIVDLELKKDEARWNAQYQQQPITEGGGILKSHHWNYWQPPGAHLPVVRVKMPDATIEERRAVELPEAFDLELQSWDCTFKEVKDADYVVGMAIAVRGANRYIRPDLTRARLDLPGTIAAVRAMTGRYPKTFSKLIEGKANGPAVIQMLRGEVSGLLDIEPEGGKVARANGASPELRSGNWFLPHPLLAPWVGNPENPTESGFLAEAVVFPFGPNDDMVDAWTQAGIWIQKDGAGRVFLTSEQDIRVEPVQIGQKWPRMFGMFVSPREVAAVWIFRRPETGEHFVAVEYTAPASDPVKHAAELVKLGAWIPGVVHTKGTGRDERDGKAMTQKYRDLGVKGLEGVQDNIAAEIIGLQEALSAGKLKVCSNLHRWFDQYRLVRRDEKGALPHYNVGVIMATLAAWRHKDKMRAPLEPAAPAQVQRGPLPNGWMGA